MCVITSFSQDSEPTENDDFIEVSEIESRDTIILKVSPSFIASILSDLRYCQSIHRFMSHDSLTFF